MEYLQPVSSECLGAERRNPSSYFLFAVLCRKRIFSDGFDNFFSKASALSNLAFNITSWLSGTIISGNIEIVDLAVKKVVSHQSENCNIKKDYDYIGK